jgi:hypothetical protein
MENVVFALERVPLSLEDINSVDVRCAFYPEHLDTWNKFEEIWSQEDRTN